MVKQPSNQSDPQSIRLDKWLWAARFFKTRSMAQKAIKTGKVLYEGNKPSPSREVKIGANLTVKRKEETISFTVTALFSMRQSAKVAATMYEESQDSIRHRAQQQQLRQDKKAFIQSKPTPKKRPERNPRRKMRDLRRSPD